MLQSLQANYMTIQNSRTSKPLDDDMMIYMIGRVHTTRTYYIRGIRLIILD